MIETLLVWLLAALSVIGLSKLARNYPAWRWLAGIVFFGFATVGVALTLEMVLP